MKLDLEALFRAGAAHPSGWRRMPAVAGEAMIATSHPLATAAGLAAFGEGGNAVDAALAAAAVLTVAEPTDNGVGGDAFALVWHDGRLHGLNGSGRSPRVLDELRVDDTGPRSVTVPGAVRAWGDLAERFGRLGLDRALSRAAELADARSGLHGTDRRQVGSGATSPVPRPGDGRTIRDPRPRADARAPRGRRAGCLLPGAGRRGDRRRLVAGRAGSRRSPLGVGRAASLRLSRRRGLRAAPERAGSGCPDRTRPVRRARAGPPLAARGDEARPGRRLRARGRRPVAERAARPSSPGRPEEPRRPRPRARPDPVRPASGRDDLPLRGRRRRDGDLADPERLRHVRLRVSSRRGRASSSRTVARGSSRTPRTRTGSRPDGGRSTRSSRGCSSREGACSAPSA